MKILITGGRGMLGRTLCAELGGVHEVEVADLPEWDITNADAFLSKTLAAAPDVVIHCAAMTNVDACESQRDLAFRLNEEGTRNVAVATKAAGARLVAISTDYVFSGNPPREPWAWGEDDIANPRTVYGASKLGGERMVQMICPDSSVILRIAWLYGAGGPSFVHTMSALGMKEGAPLKVVDDQRGNPTSARAVAGAIKFLLEHPEVTGVVHGTCEGQCSWCDFAKELFRLIEAKRRAEGGDARMREIVPCTTAEFPRPAPRPANSALRKSVLNKLGYRTPRWQDALAEFVEEEF